MSRGQRSDEERERARLEREARRAHREGRPPPVAAPPTEVPPPDLAGGVTGAEELPVAERVFEPVKPLPRARRAAQEWPQEEPRAVAPPPETLAEPEPPVEPEPEPEPPFQPESSIEPEASSEPEPEPPLATEPPVELEPEPPLEPEPEPPLATEPPVEPEPEPPLEPEPEPPVEPSVEPEPEPPVEPSVEPEPEPEPEPPVEPSVEPEPEPPVEPEPEPRDEPQPPVEPEPFEDPSVEQPTDEDPAVSEPPAAESEYFHDEDLGPRSPLAPPPRRPLPPFPGARNGDPADGGQPREQRPRRRRAPLVIGILALAVLGVAGWLLASLFQPFAGAGEGSVPVTIPPGADVASIASLLERRGVVDDAFFFRARATISGRGGDFKAGDFELRRDMSYASAMDALADSPDADTLSVTIPEGRARREVEESVAGTLDGDYIAASRRSPALDPGRYGAGSVPSLEGFLFPATYELDRGATARDLVREQLRTFKREFEKVDLRFARSKNLTAYDVLIIASMVDREAQVARERPLVASVIYNRLSEGIPLGIDATIRFATGNWTEPLKVSELAIDSPYNTRTRQGLPPGPIGSPGLEAIRAAARPRRSDFLFYVVKPGTCGEHAFSETDAQFQRDVARYNSEREARGGRSPTNC